VTPVLTPGSGNKNEGPLQLSTAASSDSCGRPLVYVWDCATNKDTQKCADLIAAANAAPGEMTDYTYDLWVREELTILVYVCPLPYPGLDQCPRVMRGYTGVEPITGL
jgi:hypothetical protein